jgi:hypothetical protein
MDSTSVLAVLTYDDGPQPYLKPHPFDSYGKPPRIGEPYDMDPDETNARLDEWLVLLAKANGYADDAQSLEDEADDLRAQEEEETEKAQQISDKIAITHPEWAGLLKAEKDPRQNR